MNLSAFQQQLISGSYTKLFLELYGAETAASANIRYESAINGFRAAFGQENKCIAVISTPGRTEIGGNHTDHNAGLVLAASVNLDVIGIASINNDSVIRIVSEGFKPIEISLNELAPLNEEKYTSAALVRGVAARMKELGFTIGGFDCYMISSVPEGSGLSSSAAFEVQLASILNHLYNNGRLDAVTNAKVAQYAENNYFGKPCGLMDQTACAVGGLMKIDFQDFDNLVIEKIEFDFAHEEHILYIVKTGGSHADLNEDYAALEGEMKEIARALGQKVLRFTSKNDMFLKLSKLRSQGNDRAILRAYHYFKENEHVIGQCEALKSSDFNRFLELVIKSGQSSFMYCQNVYSNAFFKEQGLSIALMIAEDCLKGNGAWRVHGGGFAGTIQAYVPYSLTDEFEARIQSAFGENTCHRTMIRPRGTVRIDE